MRKPQRQVTPRKTRRPKGSHSVLEVAHLLGAHPQTVRRWIKAGDLMATGGGAVPYYVTQDAVDAFLARWDVR